MYAPKGVDAARAAEERPPLGQGATRESLLDLRAAHRRKRVLVARVEAGRMAKPAGAVAGAAAGVGGDVVDDVIGVGRICCKEACRTEHSRQVVQEQVVPYPPSDVVVSARRVPAHPEPSYDHLPRRI